MSKKVIRNIYRVVLTVLVTLAILLAFLYGVMAMLVYGPSKTARTECVLSVRETSAIGFLANMFVSKEEIAKIEEENSIKDTEDITDAGLVNTESLKGSDNIEVAICRGQTYYI
jgi:hypothetical protein